MFREAGNIAKNTCGIIRECFNNCMATLIWLAARGISIFHTPMGDTQMFDTSQKSQTRVAADTEHQTPITFIM